MNVHSMLYSKLNIFKHYKLSMPLIQEIFLLKPKIFILSVNSTELKLKYLKIKLRMNFLK